MTPLEEKLARRIAATGPITVADYMAACLGDPEHGYYLTRDPLGRGGDFVTAPEISQMFGELIGAFAVATWMMMGSPSPFVLAELGPGRGTLMADLLRTGRVRPSFLDGARVHLVETSPVLRRAQEQTLTATGVPIAWHDRFEAVPAGPTIVVANEFFDALPIRQFVRSGDGWAERMVGIDEGGRLAFGLRPLGGPTGAAEPAIAGSPSSSLPLADGAVVEVSPAATAIAGTIAERVVRHGGAALIVDYGYQGPALGDTLQAAKAHRFADPLLTPGEADLTAHVDFAALAGAGRKAGAFVRPLISQGDFLIRLGLAERAEALASGKDDAGRASIAADVERLAGREAMGDLFKVFAFSHPALALPVFDADA